MNTADLWEAPPLRLKLGTGEVHVWRAGLDLGDGVLQALWPTLAPDEQARAQRFHFPKDRDHYVAGRGILRDILSRYAGDPPGELRFVYNPHGKPALAAAAGQGGLRFNVSHSHGLALFAVTQAGEVGVDLERIRPEFVTEQIAEHFFAPEEVAALRALSRAEQTQAFFDCWARKEAFLKAHGAGLSIPLDQFVVTLGPGAGAALVSTRFDPPAASGWGLQSLAAGAEYAAALAVEASTWTLRQWQWE